MDKESIKTGLSLFFVFVLMSLFFYFVLDLIGSKIKSNMWKIVLPIAIISLIFWLWIPILGGIWILNDDRYDDLYFARQYASVAGRIFATIMCVVVLIKQAKKKANHRSLLMEAAAKPRRSAQTMKRYLGITGIIILLYLGMYVAIRQKYYHHGTMHTPTGVGHECITTEFKGTEIRIPRYGAQRPVSRLLYWAFRPVGKLEKALGGRDYTCVDERNIMY